MYSRKPIDSKFLSGLYIQKFFGNTDKNILNKYPALENQKCKESGPSPGDLKIICQLKGRTIEIRELGGSQRSLPVVISAVHPICLANPPPLL